jgi:predicted O-methyltransferase YrrM
MRFYLATLDVVRILGVVVAIMVLALVGWLIAGPASLGIVVAIATGIVLIALVQLDRRNRLENLRLQDRNYRRIESLLALHNELQPAAPLPPMRGWAASPDLLRQLMELVRRQRPATIVEAGCGLSTLVCGYALRRTGEGRIVALEHDREYAERCREQLAEHGLQQIAEVRDAPLSEAVIRGERWKWYDLSALEDVESIDLLIIDGPPEHVQPLARYPALPLLADRLSEGAIAVLDDGDREGERLCVERWLAEMTGFSSEYLPLEKGAFILRRRGRPRPSSSG